MKTLLRAIMVGGLAWWSGPAQATTPVTIDHSELRKFNSGIMGREFTLEIQVPDDYAAGARRYPVLYLLDGDYAFGMATDIAAYLFYGGHVPGLIIVSPIYGSRVWTSDGGQNRRMSDYAFAGDRQATLPVNGEKFLRFLKEELIPFVDATYRTDPGDRTIAGYSMGGRFVLGALFREPRLFKRCIVVDCAPDAVADLEKSFSENPHELPVKLFFGARGGRPEVTRFIALLKSRGYAGLDVRYAELSDPSHLAIPAEGLTRGLKAVFEGDPRLVKPAAAEHSKQRLTEILAAAVEDGGPTAAIAKFEEMKRTAPNDYPYDLNPLVRALLAKGRKEEALTIARYNLAQNPSGSPGIYQALGDAYRSLGQTNSALENYRKSLALRADNPVVIRAVRELSGGDK